MHARLRRGSACPAPREQTRRFRAVSSPFRAADSREELEAVSLAVTIIVIVVLVALVLGTLALVMSRPTDLRRHRPGRRGALRGRAHERSDAA
jgi:hypothetical protein